MKLEIHVHVHNHDEPGDVLDLLGELSTKFDNLGKEVKQMALDLSALKQAETDHNAAIQKVSDHIDELLAKLAATDPADQAAIDAITADIQTGTAALVAAATKGNAPTA